jgi:hypothetical protein
MERNFYSSARKIGRSFAGFVSVLSSTVVTIPSSLRKQLRNVR